MRFRHRVDAGRQLAEQLTKYAGRSDVIVLGFPRGGIPVAHEVATRLNAPLDVFLVRKLGVPSRASVTSGQSLLPRAAARAVRRGEPIRNYTTPLRRQLNEDPEIGAHDIAVVASDGVITLTGFVTRLAEKLAAEQTTERVRGVRAVGPRAIVRRVAGR